MRRPIALALTIAALTTAGCGPNLVGAGNPDRLHADYQLCKWDDRPWYGWIPDPLGASSYAAEGQCMGERGWTRDNSKLMGWRRASP